MEIFLIILGLWLLVGMGTTFWIFLHDGDITNDDILYILLGGILGFVGIYFLFDEGVLEKPDFFKFFKKDYVWFKRINKK